MGGDVLVACDVHEFVVAGPVSPRCNDSVTTVSASDTAPGPGRPHPHSPMPPWGGLWTLGPLWASLGVLGASAESRGTPTS